MAIQQLKLPIFNDVYYSYSISLEGNRYVITFLYLERLEQWLVTLKTSDGIVLVKNQRLTPDAPLFFDYRLPNLTGFFYFKAVSQFVSDNGSANLTQPKGFYELFYIYDDGE